MIARTPISDLDPDLVAALQADMTARLQAAFPALDFRRGVYHDRIVYLSAILAADEQALVDAIQQSGSLLDIQANPDLADPTLVDRVLSNYRVERIAGAAASGPLTIVVATLAPLTIPAGMTFAIGAVQVATSAVTAVRVDASQVTSAGDRVLARQPDGTYAFTLTATAVAVGIAGMLRRGAAAVPDAPPPNFVKAFIPSDWSGGADGETNAQLVARFQAGIAAPVFSNRTNVAAMLKAVPAFAGLRGLSIIGAGDVELLRSRHGLFPVSLPGYCDVYVRAAALPLATVVRKTATLVAKTADGGVWQFSVGRDDAPGFYEVAQVLRAGDDPTRPGYEVTSDVRGVDLSGTGHLPDVREAVEAAYSRYQTAVIQFLDTDTPAGTLTLGTATAAYDVVLRGQPLLAGLQDYLSGRGVSWPGGDVLVRGALPCTLRLNFTVYVQPNSPALDTAAVASTLADLVNGQGFVGQLYASSLIDAVAALLPPGAAIGPLDMFGVVRRPDGTTLLLRDGTVLTIPTEASTGVTPRTAIFILDPADVAVSVANLALPEV